MTLMETLVKQELENRTGKVWEREVVSKNGNEIIAFVSKVDGFSPCFYMKDLEYTLKRNPNITIIQYISDFLNSADMDKSVVDNIKAKINDFNLVKDNLKVRVLAGKTDCCEKLSCELYAVPYVKFHEQGMDMSVNVNNSILKAWNKTFEEVYEIAKENTRKEIEISSMKDIILELSLKTMNLSDDEIEDARAYMDEMMPDDNMQVLSNKSRHLGAAAIIYDDVLNEVADKLGEEKIIILPSSVHEVIAIPYSGDTDRFVEMVKEVNGTEVEPKDRLIDAILVWDRKTLEKLTN